MQASSSSIAIGKTEERGTLSRRAALFGVALTASAAAGRAEAAPANPSVEAAAAQLADAMRATYGGAWVVNIDQVAGFAVVRRDYSRSASTYSA